MAIVKQTNWRTDGEEYGFAMSDLINRTFHTVTGSEGDEKLILVDGEYRFCFFHEQNCCESVYIYDVVGDLTDLVGVPILDAYEANGESPVEVNEDNYESMTWTFYHFRTIKGSVTIRWLGTSNGCYSESVSHSATKV